MKYLIFILLSFPALAVDNNYCQLNSPQPDEFIPSNEVSGNYWTNMMGDHTVVFTAQGGVSGEYQAYDLNTREAIKLTTSIDPFPVPDGRHAYIHPSPLAFYNFDDVKTRIQNGANGDALIQNAAIKPEGVTPGTMGGYYESIGVIQSNKSPTNNFSVYRVLTGQSEGDFQDYRVTYNSQGRVERAIATGPAKKMCPNLRTNNSGVELDFDTPILSPNGKEFAITDRKTNSTKIIAFDPANGNCRVAQDLGFEAGKIHFSPDGSKIAFHSQSISIGSTRMTTSNNRGYMLDRNTNKLVSLKVGADDEQTTEQYPAFLPDGRIIYQRVKYDPETRTQSRAWVKVDPKKLNEVQFSVLDEDDCAQDKNLPLLAIGKLYREVCRFRPVSGADLMLTLNLDPAKCRSLVNDNWEQNRARVVASLNETANPDKPVNDRTLTKAMLAAACPLKALTQRNIMHEGDSTQMRYPAVIGERCIVCHTPNSPHGYIPFDDPAKMKTMGALGGSAQPGNRYYGKTLIEQMSDILQNNRQGMTPPAGVPRVPADGPRLTNGQIDTIMNWVSNGRM
jgi:hypothetical protein